MFWVESLHVVARVCNSLNTNGHITGGVDEWKRQEMTSLSKDYSMMFLSLLEVKCRTRRKKPASKIFSSTLLWDARYLCSYSPLTLLFCPFRHVKEKRQNVGLVQWRSNVNKTPAKQRLTSLYGRSGRYHSLQMTKIKSKMFVRNVLFGLWDIVYLCALTWKKSKLQDKMWSHYC